MGQSARTNTCPSRACNMMHVLPRSAMPGPAPPGHQQQEASRPNSPPSPPPTWPPARRPRSSQRCARACGAGPQRPPACGAPGPPLPGWRPGWTTPGPHLGCWGERKRALGDEHAMHARESGPRCCTTAATWLPAANGLHKQNMLAHFRQRTWDVLHPRDPVGVAAVQHLHHHKGQAGVGQAAAISLHCKLRHPGLPNSHRGDM